MIRTSCAVVLVVLAVLHSLLGERRLLAPLFAHVRPREAQPLGRAFTERTLRFVWHQLSVAWLALAWLVARGDESTVFAVGTFLLVSGGLALVVSRGRHFAWALFVVGGATALVGPRPGGVMPWAAWVAALVLFAIALVHLSWVLGAKWGLAAALPEVSGRPAFVPPRWATVVVTGAFVAAAAVVLASSRGGSPYVSWLTLAGALVFALRALGDFRLVGLTKRVHGTRFSRWDDVLYTPLCVLLALAFAVVGARGLA
jgi:hypothetical protein